MSLILGIPLTRVIYLVSDSRVTEGGDYKDNMSKWNNLNSRLGVVGAHDLQLASYLIREIRKEVGEDDDFGALEKTLKDKLYQIAYKFYEKTGSYKQRAYLIFGGFDDSKQLRISSSDFGIRMAEASKNHRTEGREFNQMTDTRIFEAMSKISNENISKGGDGSVDPGTILEIDAPRPRCVGVRVSFNGQLTEIKWESAELYQSISYHPGWDLDRVKLPEDIMASLEYPVNNGQLANELDIIFNEYTNIINATRTILDQRGYSQVGGNIIPLRIGDDKTLGIATGSMAKKSNPNKIIGGLKVVNGALHYYDEEGELHKYENLIDLPEGDISTTATI
jgi:hypothetical protein